VPQFRVLAFLKRHPGAGVSAIAEHIGITMPTASKLIDGLVNRELIAREASPEDRRRVSLKVTKAGESAWKASRRDLQPKIAGMLANLSPEDIAAISRAMEVLRSVFGQEQDTNGHC
jgi:DNA-binding MarR family transcriptional regulator